MVEQHSETFLDQFRVDPIQEGDKIKHPNFGNGVVIAVCNGKCWVLLENGKDHLFKMNSLVNSKIVKIIY